MADEKSGKGSGMGPFELGQRYDEVGPDLGRLHEAWHVETGRPALRLFLSDRVQWQSSGRWAALVVFEPSPLSVTVLMDDASVAVPTPELANVLVLASAAVTRVEGNARVGAHLVSGLRGPEGRPPRVSQNWRERSWRVVAGLVLALGVWLLASRHEPLSQGQVAGFPCPADAFFLADVDDPSPAAPAYPLPDKPFRNQGTPPCKTKKAAVEINGGCWVELAQKPPCDDEVAEYKGKCYLPTTKGKPLPQSVEP